VGHIDLRVPRRHTVTSRTRPAPATDRRKARPRKGEDLAIDTLTMHGTSGPPVLLLPGATASCDGFFPGLVEGLVTDPGCRVVVHDRPGTGTSPYAGTLTGAADHRHRLVTDLELGPVVVVGQSLGGTVAALYAAAHPEDIAGIVLLDPSPINDPGVCEDTVRLARIGVHLASIPVIGRPMMSALASVSLRKVRRAMRPDCAATLDRTTGIDIGRIELALDGLVDLARNWQPVALPRVPAAVVAANRNPSGATQQALARLASQLGTTMVTWPGAAHAVHLTHPDEVLGVVRDVIAKVTTH
jgi:pimeloyl-ACP methyl ester carboxylesterase